MIYKTFEQWKAGQWLEDDGQRTEAYTKDELLLIEMGWQYGFDAGKEVKELTDEEILISAQYNNIRDSEILDEYVIDFARAILKKAQEK